MMSLVLALQLQQTGHNSRLLWGRHQQKFLNVTPGSEKTYHEQSSLYFSLLHGSLTTKYSLKHCANTREVWTSALDWRWWHLHSSLKFSHSHQSLYVPSLTWHSSSLAVAGWRMYPFQRLITKTSCSPFFLHSPVIATPQLREQVSLAGLLKVSSYGELLIIYMWSFTWTSQDI